MIFAGRWIAGPNISDAMKRARELNELGVSAIINYMGEEFERESDCNDAVATCMQLAKAIKKKRLDASISVKITQMGLRIGRGIATRNYGKVVGFARKLGIFVWLDMESQDTVSDAIFIYLTQVKRSGVGIAMQAYLRRTEGDAALLVKKKAVIRLVKGAYKADKKTGFAKREEVEQNYIKIMRYLFKKSQKFTIATHDSMLINEAIMLNRVHRRNVTYGMLNGIRNNYAAELAASGNKVALYVPFGSRWFDYSLRRMNEWSHVMLILRSLLGG